MLKVSWERSFGDYTAAKLKEIFERFGEVEDIVIRSKKSKSKASAIVVMSSKDAVVSLSCFLSSGKVWDLGEYGINKQKKTAFITTKTIWISILTYWMCRGHEKHIKKKKSHICKNCHLGATFRKLINILNITVFGLARNIILVCLGQESLPVPLLFFSVPIIWNIYIVTYFACHWSSSFGMLIS